MQYWVPVSKRIPRFKVSKKLGTTKLNLATHGPACSLFGTELHSACYKNPCVNEGKCVVLENTPSCICNNGFTGNTCEGLLPYIPITSTEDELNLIK